jgi:hypothetical protein
VSVIAWFRVYAAHADPSTAAANLVSLVVAGNGPFYPLYVLAAIGRADARACLTVLASPLFLAIPALSRRSSVAGRLALPLAGTLNTLWCVALFGSDSSVGLFLLPCIVLAVLLFRIEERGTRLLLIGLVLTAQIALSEKHFVGLVPLGPGDAASLARLNSISVATLMAFIAITLARLVRGESQERSS